MPEPVIALKDASSITTTKFFDQSKRKPDEIDFLMQRYLDNVQSSLPAEMTTTDKRRVLREFKQTLHMNRSIMKALIADEPFMQTFAQQKQQLKALEAVTMPEQVEPILTRLTNTLPRFETPSAYTIAAMLLLLIPAVASQMIYQAYDGSPPGGLDLCAGQNAPLSYVSCLQGTVTRLNSSATVLQFDQIIQRPNIVQGQNVDYQAFNILVGCLGWDKMANMTITALMSATQNATQNICNAQSTIWNTFQATASLVGPISEIACANFQENFTFTAQHCMNNDAYFVNNAIIWGSIVGGIVGILCIIGCVALACVCCENICDRMPSCA